MSCYFGAFLPKMMKGKQVYKVLDESNLFDGIFAKPGQVEVDGQCGISKDGVAKVLQKLAPYVKAGYVEFVNDDSDTKEPPFRLYLESGVVSERAVGV